MLLRPRVLRNVSNIDTSITILGKRYQIPIAIAPSAYQRLANDGGEKDMVRAARALGTNMVLSTNATTSVEDVAMAAHCKNDSEPNLWLQLYVFNDRSMTQTLLKRARRSGCEAVVVTVDTPVIGNRLCERRTPLSLPPSLSRPNMPAAKGSAKSRLILNAKTAAEAQKLKESVHETLNDATLTWEDLIPWLRANTDLKILVKGIMTAEDAILAMKYGVDGIVVSNHGGRQLDGTLSTLEALSEVADVVKGKILIVFDGGIEKGSDVFKAIALGADLCLIGRSALWGLAYDGQQGVENVLNILERELSRTMALTGAPSIKDISREMLGVKRRGSFGVAKL